MKRISLVLLTGFIFTSLAQAQVVDFNQFGKAAQAIMDERLSIAHPSLPLNSRVKVANTRSGKEVEVIVRGRIPASPNWIAALSPAVWEELDLTPTTDIRIFMSSTPRPRPRVVEASPPVPEEPLWFTVEPDPLPEEALWFATEPDLPADEPVLLVVESLPAVTEPEPVFILPPLFVSEPVVEPVTGSAAGPIAVARPLPSANESAGTENETQTPRQPIHITVKNFITTTPDGMPVYPGDVSVSGIPDGMKIVPRLPDPRNGRIYKLQVGAFASIEAAERIAQRIRVAGFNVVEEQYGQLYRVIAAGVPSAMVQSALQRLGTLGIKEVWIRE